MIALPPPAISEAVTTGFAPVLDTAYRYHIEQERDEAGVVRRYATDRTVRFRRTPTGLTAEMTIDSVAGGLSDGPGAMFERAFATLLGQPIVYRLSARGDVIDVMDRAVLWAKLIDAVSAQSKGDPARTAMLQKLTAPLRTLPEQQQVAMLGSMLSTLLAPDVVRRGVIPQRDIRQQGKPPFDGGSDVTGTERIHAEGTALVEEQRLSGAVVARGGAVSGRRISLVTRRVDGRSGMILAQQTVVRIESGLAMSTATTRISQREP
ncbi:hypothetical protein [Sphingomonas panni]|uniref:hypothetical protein n=1 Tax=Sphingomonas panni TaxID=237612 RepID=UPI001F5BCDAB|nr:hypothetical protein [Sphingomonas panni]